VSELTGRGAALPGRLRRFLTGPAGPGPAGALAVIALLSAFVAAAGPREFTALQNNALRQDVASAGSFGISAQTSWQIPATAGPDQLSAAQIQKFGASISSQIGPPLISPAARRWAGLTTPFRQVENPAPAAILSGPPMLEIAYRSDLAGNSRLVSGSFPGAATYLKQAGQPVAIVQAAVTTATAARLGLRLGSEASLASNPLLPPGDPSIVLRVTGIIRPTDPASSFWTTDPSLAAPTLSTSVPPEWQGGVLVGPVELPAVEAGSAVATVALSWNFPLDTSGLTAAQVPGYLQAMTATQTNAGEVGLGSTDLPAGSNASLTVSADGTGTLGDFEAVQAAVGTTDSLFTVGLFAVALILLLICAVVLADAYRGELALVQARGGSTTQVTARVAARCAGVAVPALAAGTLLAVLVTPGGGTAVSWLLTAMVVITTLAAPALLTAWRHRRPQSLSRVGRDDLTVPRRSARRTVAEITVLVAIAGGVVALRQRGLAPGAGVDPYVSSAPVLVALAAGLIAARVYPVPLRQVLRLASGRRSAVGYLGLAQAARSRSRSSSLLPALALVVALAVIALGGMVRAAVGRGQAAASWQQVGADAVIQAQGARPDISPAAQRAIASVPGVRHGSAVYEVSAGSALAANLLVGTTGATSTGVVIVNPAQYAALAGDTPWPAFPAGLLAGAREGGTGGRGTAVPVIASPGVAAAVRAGSDHLAFASSQLTLRVAATVAATPAMPGGGTFVIISDWAAAKLRASTAPNTMLLTGAAISVRALRAAAARTQPGSRVVSRAEVLQATAGSPSVRGSDLLFELCVGAGAACCAAAVLLGLLLTGRDRTRLAAWLAALGLTDRQARRLAMLDALPMVLIAVVGAELAGAALGPLIGPALDLSAFTGSGAPVSVRPDPAALILPPAGLIVLVVLITVGQSVLTRRRTSTGVLRLDEGG
jgi:putative ABC transport system permease protein